MMKIRTIFANAGAVAMIIFLAPIFLVFLFPLIFLPARIRFRCRMYYAGTSMFFRAVLWAGFLKIRVFGREKLQALKKTRVIIVANHQSALDGLILDSLLESEPRICFSNDYSKMPIIGTILKQMHIIVYKMSLRSSKKALDDAIALAHEYGPHVLIFPEGSRHADGEIHDFYRGFAFLAESLARPVVPILLRDVYKVLPRGQKYLTPSPGVITVRIGDPFVFDAARESREEFLAKVHNWFTLENQTKGCGS